MSSSFLVRFQWFKTWWVRHVGIYKTSLYPIGKDATIKDLKLEILPYFDSPKTKHWTPVHQTPNNFLIPLSNGAIFAAL
jgi:hypothetical protein